MAVWVTAGLSSTISSTWIPSTWIPFLNLVPFFYISYLSFYSLCLFCYPLFLYVYSYKIHPWKSPISPWCNQQRKETDQDTVYCDSYIFTSDASLYHFLDSFFSVLSKPNQFNMVSFKFLFYIIT